MVSLFFFNNKNKFIYFPYFNELLDHLMICYVLYVHIKEGEYYQLV